VAPEEYPRRWQLDIAEAGKPSAVVSRSAFLE